jgi:tRNA (mo5U34)-methyltransferase
MNIGDFTSNVAAQEERLRDARSQVAEEMQWYPYNILGNVFHLDRMLTGENRDLDRLVQGLPVIDIGAADGDLSFALENVGGWDIDLVDTAATNMNGLRGARALRDQLSSTVKIYDIDLDRRFTFPRERYGLAFLLGTLYHLQNPYYMMKELASHASHCMLSTRVARFAGPERTAIGDLPVGYLLAPNETNQDSTNYWILSPAGLERLVQRAGWTILDRLNVGNTEESDPSGPENDERMFLLLESMTVGSA